MGNRTESLRSLGGTAGGTPKAKRHLARATRGEESSELQILGRNGEREPAMFVFLKKNGPSRLLPRGFPAKQQNGSPILRNYPCVCLCLRLFWGTAFGAGLKGNQTEHQNLFWGYPYFPPYKTQFELSCHFLQGVTLTNRVSNKDFRHARMLEQVERKS